MLQRPAFVSFAPVAGGRHGDAQSRATRRTRAQPAVAQLSFGDKVEKSLIQTFGADAIPRVLESFRAVREGRTHEKGEGTATHRKAHSYVEGLDALPFHEVSMHPWVARLEENWEEIAGELAQVQADPETARRGTNVWVAAARQEATAYGPDWRTLVLQDREWDPVNAELFPKATALLRDSGLEVPSVEAFYARQSPDTGIALHTDDCNFILTMHLSLDVPPGQSWIEVAGERRYWENGKALIFDTSYFHRTMNESKTKDRTVLLIRFWHPQLSIVERDALSHVFRAIEDPSIVESVGDEKKSATQTGLELAGGQARRGSSARKTRGASRGHDRQPSRTVQRPKPKGFGR